MRLFRAKPLAERACSASLKPVSQLDTTYLQSHRTNVEGALIGCLERLNILFKMQRYRTAVCALQNDHRLSATPAQLD